jgi:hypothetical protein
MTEAVMETVPLMVMRAATIAGSDDIRRGVAPQSRGQGCGERQAGESADNGASKRRRYQNLFHRFLRTIPE